eukprot:SAG31_NODE_684_length_12833_cov_8.046411_2_plen_69_part_00
MPSTQSGSGMELFGQKVTNGQLGLAAVGLFVGLTVITRRARNGAKEAEMLRKQVRCPGRLKFGTPTPL